MVLEKSGKARKRILLGPSTPLYGDVFAGSVDMLSGMVPEDKEGVIEIVGQGGGTLHFKKHSRKVNVILNGGEK